MTTTRLGVLAFRVLGVWVIAQAAIAGVFGSSVQTGVGAILVIFHPILAAFLAPSVED